MEINGNLAGSIGTSVLNTITSLATCGIQAHYNNKNSQEDRELQRIVEENRLNFEKYKWEESCKMQRAMLREQKISAIEQMQENFRL